MKIIRVDELNKKYFIGRQYPVLLISKFKIKSNWSRISLNSGYFSAEHRDDEDLDENRILILLHDRVLGDRDYLQLVYNNENVWVFMVTGDD